MGNTICMRQNNYSMIIPEFIVKMINDLNNLAITKDRLGYVELINVDLWFQTNILHNELITSHKYSIESFREFLNGKPLITDINCMVHERNKMISINIKYLYISFGIISHTSFTMKYE